MRALSFQDNQPNFKDKMKRDKHRYRYYGISKISIWFNSKGDNLKVLNL